MATNGAPYHIESQTEKGLGSSPDKSSVGPSVSHISVAEVGREHLSETLAPHESYEGKHRWDPSATWTEAEERRCVRKTDMMLLSWICVMVSCPCSDMSYQKLIIAVLRLTTRSRQSIERSDR